MPVIKVISSDSPTQAPTQGHLAAAVMAVALAKASEPLEVHGRRKKSRTERTRPRNPNSLTVNQHVFPSKSIERFTNQSGNVSVHDLRRVKIFPTKSRNAIFCASRAWDERVETGYMRRIEAEFQKIVDPIVDGKVGTVAPEHKPAIDRMHALWHMRSRYRALDLQEIELKGNVGSNLTKEQEENLEKNGYMFARKGGTMPARQLNGFALQLRIDHYVRDLATSVTRWGIISAQSGDFIVPDVPSHGIIPLTPRLALVQSAPDGMITEQNVAEINQAMRATSQDYFFARDVSSCPF